MAAKAKVICGSLDFADYPARAAAAWSPNASGWAGAKRFPSDSLFKIDDDVGHLGALNSAEITFGMAMFPWPRFPSLGPGKYSAMVGGKTRSADQLGAEGLARQKTIGLTDAQAPDTYARAFGIHRWRQEWRMYGRAMVSAVAAVSVAVGAQMVDAIETVTATAG